MGLRRLVTCALLHMRDPSGLEKVCYAFDEAKQVKGLGFCKCAAERVLVPVESYSSKGGCWVGSKLKRFLQTSRSLENLSSGENLAGCADSVGLPSGAAFCISEVPTSAIQPVAQASSCERPQ